MGWLKKLWRCMFKNTPPVVPSGCDLHAEIEKRRIEEGKKLDELIEDSWWKPTGIKEKWVPGWTSLSDIPCPKCGGQLIRLPRKIGPDHHILACRPCNKAFIPPEVWEDPNFQQDITQHGCDTSEVKNVYGDPMPSLMDSEYDPDEVMTKIYDAHLDKEIARSDRRLANEIDAARSFGQAYIEEKHGIPFSEWVKNRKDKEDAGTE